jgi:phosphoribosylformylglycinamidine synthase
MKLMKIGVVIFPGSNCDHDMIYALGDILGHEVVELWHKDHDLQQVDWVVLPGGFSYGDYLRSGAIARFSPIMAEVVQHARRGGYVLGVCNGFQVLCETGLLPGTLQHNLSHRFVCQNTHLRSASPDHPFTAGLEAARPYKIPVAHGEGRYYADEATVKELEDQGQILFQYCDAEGLVSEEANFNGSVANIAGVSNAGQNVIGMMPHPERAADPNLGNTDGRALLESFLLAAGQIA